ncbi:hypothetical protein BT67DRAFT_406174 [Trichocladium antarcticum]|uniref:Uncharacterized protein n=1 Tax=Trichocladium antarcticum TaxID=1450529 RepID=A0AAN6UGV7_9PEZI|nr:hypothetical protein BT67DRAFT_406174 [Trichocladium antarcticum]
MEELSLLILGAGWTATFLIPLLQSRKIPFAATTTSGRPVAGVPTIPFKLDPSAPEDETRSAIAALPRARYILITFPLTGKGSSKLLIDAYESTHRTAAAAAAAAASASATTAQHQFRFIQLGSTGIWQPHGSRTRTTTTTTTSTPPPPPPPPPTTTTTTTTSSDPWRTRHSPHSTSTPRAVAEDELLALGGCVLNLAGLWGGARNPRHWVGRVAATKEAVRAKTSLHLVHGVDVARAVVAVVDDGADEGLLQGEGRWERAGRGQRWMVTDGWVYDWWGLLAGWAEVRDGEEVGEGDSPGVSEQARWVFELMGEEGVRALPRAMEVLGRCYDSREFWETWGLVPLKGRAG